MYIGVAGFVVVITYLEPLDSISVKLTGLLLNLFNTQLSPVELVTSAEYVDDVDAITYFVPSQITETLFNVAG